MHKDFGPSTKDTTKFLTNTTDKQSECVCAASVQSPDSLCGDMYSGRRAELVLVEQEELGDDLEHVIRYQQEVALARQHVAVLLLNIDVTTK